MGLEGIFDPMVRAYCAGQGGGAAENSVKIIKACTVAEAEGRPMLPMSMMGSSDFGYDLYKVFDETPSIQELEGGFISIVVSEDAHRTLDGYTTYLSETPRAVWDNEVGTLMNSLDELGAVFIFCTPYKDVPQTTLALVLYDVAMFQEMFEIPLETGIYMAALADSVQIKNIYLVYGMAKGRPAFIIEKMGVAICDGNDTWYAGSAGNVRSAKAGQPWSSLFG